MAAAETSPTSLAGGRYLLYDELASGGMASVHLGRLVGTAGFSRTVAIKRMHPQLAKDPDFVVMFIDEARLAARIRHPNVVATVDVVAQAEEIFIVMEYILGESLSSLMRAVRKEGAPAPSFRVAVRLIADILNGLHAAHEATNERGDPLRLVHRDVSPQNVLVGRDGVARVVDFGVAKAASRLYTTKAGRMKGKLAYMSPEQVEQKPLDRRADVFAASIVLWETLTGRRLFTGEDASSLLVNVLHAKIEPPSTIASDVPQELDRIVMKGLSRDRELRWESAHAMAEALESTIVPARAAEVGAWVEGAATEALRRRAARIADIESGRADATLDARSVSRREGEVTAATMQLSPKLPSDTVPGTADSSVHERAARVRWVPLALVSLVVVFAVVALAVMKRRGAGDAVRDQASENASVVAGSSRASAKGALGTPGPWASASEASSVPASAVPLSAASPSPRATPSANLSSTNKQAPPQLPKKKKASCNPPYVVDADGVVRFKSECI